jgi:GTP cyclohydrolase I
MEVISMNSLLKAYTAIVEHLKENASRESAKANFEGTAERVVRALLETNLSDKAIREEIQKYISVSFPVEKIGKYLGLITQGPITINSCCPHHLALVRYEAYVSYLPKEEQVLGLSKLSRIVKVLGKRPVLQEQLAADIVDVLFCSQAPCTDFIFPSIQSKGSAVMLVGLHLCMACRGVQEDALTSVVDLRGIYRSNEFEQKFYSAVDSIRHAKPF